MHSSIFRLLTRSQMYEAQKITPIRYQEGKHGQCSEAFLGQQMQIN